MLKIWTKGSAQLFIQKKRLIYKYFQFCVSLAQTTFIKFVQNMYVWLFLREAHGNKTLVLLQGAWRARNTSPLGRVFEL